MEKYDKPNRDFGHSIHPPAALTKALLDDGPLHGEVLFIQEIEEQSIDDGHYAKDPACTYTSPEGERCALYLWIKER